MAELTVLAEMMDIMDRLTEDERVTVIELLARAYGGDEVEVKRLDDAPAPVKVGDTDMCVDYMRHFRGVTDWASADATRPRVNINEGISVERPQSMEFGAFPADAPLPKGTVLMDGHILFHYNDKHDVYLAAHPCPGWVTEREVSMFIPAPLPLVKEYLHCVNAIMNTLPGMWWVRDEQDDVCSYDSGTGAVRKATPANVAMALPGVSLTAPKLLRYEVISGDELRGMCTTRREIYESSTKIFVCLNDDEPVRFYEVCSHAYLTTREGIKGSLEAEGESWILPDYDALLHRILDAALGANRNARFPEPHEFWNGYSTLMLSPGNALRWVVPIRPLKGILSTTSTGDGIAVVHSTETVHWPDERMPAANLEEHAMRDPQYFYMCLDALGVMKINNLRLYATGRRRPTDVTVCKHVKEFMSTWGYAVSNKNSYDLVAGIE